MYVMTWSVAGNITFPYCFFSGIFQGTNRSIVVRWSHNVWMCRDDAGAVWQRAGNLSLHAIRVRIVDSPAKSPLVGAGQNSRGDKM